MTSRAGPLLVVRADVGPEMGMGHFMRSLAIAQAWIDLGGRADLVMACGAAVVDGRCEHEGVALRSLEVEPGSPADAERTISLARSSRASVLLIDGYVFSSDYQERVVRAAIRCAVVDDHARLDWYPADVVVDANLVAVEDAYRERTRGRVLAGLRYALLRREFRTAVRLEPRPGKRRLLITFGGSDVQGLTERALSVLAGDVDVTVLVGGANPRAAQIARVAASLPRVRVLVDADNVPDVMARADVALSAAGSTCAELAFMGLPAVVVVTAENQRQVAEGFDRLGAVRVLGEEVRWSDVALQRAVSGLLDDPAARAGMSERGRAAVDGLGALRVAEVLRELA